MFTTQPFTDEFWLEMATVDVHEDTKLWVYVGAWKLYKMNGLTFDGTSVSLIEYTTDPTVLLSVTSIPIWQIVSNLTNKAMIRIVFREFDEDAPPRRANVQGK